MTRKLGLLILLVFLALAIPLWAGAETSGTCGDNLTWTLDENGLLTISGSGTMTGLYNLSNAWCAFSSDIQNVVIESGVTSIGSQAFMDCSNLTSVTIPDSVTIIGDTLIVFCSKKTSMRPEAESKGLKRPLISGRMDDLKQQKSALYNLVISIMKP